MTSLFIPLPFKLFPPISSLPVIRLKSSSSLFPMDFQLFPLSSSLKSFCHFLHIRDLMFTNEKDKEGNNNQRIPVMFSIANAACSTGSLSLSLCSNVGLMTESDIRVHIYDCSTTPTFTLFLTISIRFTYLLDARLVEFRMSTRALYFCGRYSQCHPVSG